MKRVAIYVRVSTEEQAREGYSLEAQLDVLTQYSKNHNYNITNTYIEDGVSAKDIVHRPQLKQLLSDAQNDKFDIVLVWKLTRFTRRLQDLENMCDLLEKNNVYLVSCSESFDCTTPAGRMLRGVLGTVAQFEREVISENVRLAMFKRAAKGIRTCSCVLGYDIKKGERSIHINEKEAEMIRFIFREYMRTKNLSYVAERCREKGYRGKRGKVQKASSVQKILTRPIYMGYYTFNDHLIKGDFIPIISVDKYLRVQKMLKKYGHQKSEWRTFDATDVRNAIVPEMRN